MIYIYQDGDPKCLTYSFGCRKELTSTMLLKLGLFPVSTASSHEAQEILTHLLQSLEIFLKASSASKKRSPGAVNISLAQALPSDILVKIGETHLSDSRVITPLCSCIVMQVTWTQPTTLLVLVVILYFTSTSP